MVVGVSGTAHRPPLRGPRSRAQSGKASGETLKGAAGAGYIFGNIRSALLLAVGGGDAALDDDLDDVRPDDRRPH